MFDCDILVFQMFAQSSVEFSRFTGAKEDTNRKKLVNFCIKFKILKKIKIIILDFLSTQKISSISSLYINVFSHEKATEKA